MAPQTIQRFEILTCPGGLAAQPKTMDFFKSSRGWAKCHPSPGGNSTQVLPVELAIDDIAVVPQFKAGSYYIHKTKNT